MPWKNVRNWSDRDIIQEKSIKKNAIFNSIRIIMTMLFPLITFPYATRVLGPSGIGKVDFSSSIVAYFVLIASLGINTYGIREGAKLRDDRNGLSSFVQEIFAINLITTVIAYILFFWAVLNIRSLTEYREVLLITSITIGFSTLGIEWLYGALEEYQYITVRTGIFQVISIIMLFLLVKDTDDYLQYAAITIFAVVGSNIFNLIHSTKYISWKKKEKLNLRRHVRSICIIFGLNLACNIYMNLDKTMLGLICGDKAVGFYTAALKINRLILSIVLSLGTVTMARLSYYIEIKEKQKFEKLLFKIMNYVILLGIPAAIGLLILSRPILLVMCGPEYLGAVKSMRILTLIIPIIGISNIIAVQIFIPVGKEHYPLIASSCAALINFGMNFWLIGAYKEVGASISTICAETAALIICIMLGGKIMDIHYLFRYIYQYIIAASGIFLSYFILGGLIEKPLIYIVAVTSMGCAFYMGILILLKNPFAYEMIKSVIKRRH